MKKTNHLLHITLTLFTGGLWLIAYIPMVILRKSRNGRISPTYANSISELEPLAQKNFRSRLKNAIKSIDKSVPWVGLALVAAIGVGIFIVGNIVIFVLGYGLIWLAVGVASQKTNLLLIVPILLSLLAMYQNSIAKKYRTYLLVYSLATRNEKARYLDEKRGTIMNPVYDPNFLDAYSSEIVESFYPRKRYSHKTEISSQSEIQDFKRSIKYGKPGGVVTRFWDRNVEPIQIGALNKWIDTKETASILYLYAGVSVPIVLMISFIAFAASGFDAF